MNSENAKDILSFHEYFKRNEIFMRLPNLVLEYDKAIRSCADDPEKMSSFCTAEDDTLDDLYLQMVDWASLMATGEEYRIERIKKEEDKKNGRNKT